MLQAYHHVLCQDQLESVLEVLHRQMEQYKDQPQHAEKISYQQRLLQEDLIHIRAEISKVSTVCGFGCFKKTVIRIPVRVKLYNQLDRGVKSCSELIWFRILNQNNKTQSLQLSFSLPTSHPSTPHAPRLQKKSLEIFFYTFFIYTWGLHCKSFS